MKQKLIHIMMGQHNPNMQKGLDSVFDCIHYDWTNEENQKLHYGLRNFDVEKFMIEFRRFQPAIVFLHIQCDFAFMPNHITEMMQSSWVVNWTGDVRHPIPEHYIKLGKQITCTLFSNMNDVETLRTLGINSEFLQVGYDSEHFCPDKFSFSKEKYPEILFLGSNYPGSFPLSDFRLKMVKRLKMEFNSKFGLYGGGWDHSENSIKTFEEEGNAYRQCKIAINLSHFNYNRYSSDRLFRILGSGAFCLTHYYPEIEKDFELGKELVTFYDLDDLVAKINYYLWHMEQRQAIAKAGCTKAQNNLTWHHFAKNLQTISNKWRN